MNKIKYYELQAKIRKHFQKKMCLVPESMKHKCKANKPKCHTISKKASLFKIANSEKQVNVIMFNENDFFQPVGVNQATIFYGFCCYHDEKLFKPIEQNNPNLVTKEQFFLMSYRALCLRLYKKNVTNF